MSEVQGFMPDAGLATLKELATNKRVLEIGCWKGRTAAAMASVAKHVVTMDHFKGDGFVGAANTLPEAFDTLRKLDNVSIIVGDFRTLLKDIRVFNFDVVFYDADHTYEATSEFLLIVFQQMLDKRDSDEWPLVIVDDYNEATYPQVVKAVRDHYFYPDIRFEGSGLAVIGWSQEAYNRQLAILKGVQP